MLQKTKKTKDTSGEVGGTCLITPVGSGNRLPNLSEGTRMGPSLISPSLWSLAHKHGLCFRSFSWALQEGPQVLGFSVPYLMVWPGVRVNSPSYGQCTVHSPMASGSARTVSGEEVVNYWLSGMYSEFTDLDSDP
uniref:Uncharacterized protein n=1 Tax=Pipistrellus kuhlii TaxID=59472 RepID=A0A7J8A990_PIPKU|nr:hypothetical protein mPipKuh1_008892 [Pipistrellus kuhlii]